MDNTTKENSEHQRPRVEITKRPGEPIKLNWGVKPPKRVTAFNLMPELLERVKERLDTIEAAACGGVSRPHDKRQCRCDDTVGYTCEYCAIHGSVHHIRSIVECLEQYGKQHWGVYAVAAGWTLGVVLITLLLTK